METNKIVIAAGTGFLGRAIMDRFPDYEFVILCRTPKKDSARVKYVQWDGKTTGTWTKELENAEAVINLTGRSVDCRYNEENKKEILESRTHSTRIIGKAIQTCSSPPKLWINAGSATIYRHALDRPMDEETGELGEGFSVDVCKQWEAAFNEMETPKTRKVILRISMVLGKSAGVMPVLMKLVRFGLGGTQGKGNQYMSWIHESDFVNIVKWIMDHPELSGAYNCSAPNPIPNANFMQKLRKACKMPFGLPAKEWMLEIGAVIIKTETELILKSRRVVPTKLLKSGFQFQFPEADAAIDEIVNS